MITAATTIKQLDELFNTFNDHFFSGDLEKPVITISPDTRSSYGWFTTWRAWEDQTGGGYYEINICSDYLDRDPLETAETLLHEMVHLYNTSINIQDCSRGGSYHNKKFKKACDTHGLICEQSAKYGWSSTRLNDDAAEFVKSLDLSFNLNRPKVETSKTSKKSNSIKYVCPQCGAIIRATKDVNMICGDCMIPMKRA